MKHLDDEERLQVFAILRRVVWADGALTPDELSALRGAATALGLEGVTAQLSDTDGEPPMTLPARRQAREAAYTAAAWMACVDGTIADEELSVLKQLAERLGLDEERADRLLREAASASLSMTARDRAAMTAFDWSMDLRALVSWTTWRDSFAGRAP